MHGAPHAARSQQPERDVRMSAVLPSHSGGADSGGRVHQLVGMVEASWLQMGEALLAAMPRAAKDLQRSERMILSARLCFLCKGSELGVKREKKKLGL